MTPNNTPPAPAPDGEAEDLFVRIRNCWDDDECPTFNVVEPLLDRLLALSRRAALSPPTTGDAASHAPAKAAGVEGLTLFGIRIVVDETMPENAIELRSRNAHGEIISRVRALLSATGDDNGNL